MQRNTMGKCHNKLFPLTEYATKLKDPLKQYNSNTEEVLLEPNFVEK